MDIQVYTKIRKQTELLKCVFRLRCHVNFEITFQEIHITSQVVSTGLIEVYGSTI